MDFGIWGGFWNLSPTDTEGQRYTRSSFSYLKKKILPDATFLITNFLLSFTL